MASMGKSNRPRQADRGRERTGADYRRGGTHPTHTKHTRDTLPAKHQKPGRSTTSRRTINHQQDRYRRKRSSRGGGRRGLPTGPPGVARGWRGSNSGRPTRHRLTQGPSPPRSDTHRSPAYPGSARERTTPQARSCAVCPLCSRPIMPAPPRQATDVPMIP